MRNESELKSDRSSYVDELFKSIEPKLVEKSRDKSIEFEKYQISMSSSESRILACFVKASGAKKFVEIGTLTGATALWISDSMGDGGELWTFEKDLQHAQSANVIFQEYMKIYPNRKIHIITGDAIEKLDSIVNRGPFDGIFIDGNKAAYAKYLDWSEQNIKRNGLIIGDNVFLGGAVFGNKQSNSFSDKQVLVMQEFNKRQSDPNKFYGTIIETGEGLSISIKLT